MITKLYRGTIDLNFDENRHYFSVNGKSVISVTACTGVIDKSRPLIYWATGLTKDFLLAHLKDLTKDTRGDEIVRLIEEAVKQHQIKLQKAADAGTEAHKWCELFIKAKTLKDTPELPKDPKVYNAVTAFLKWVDEYEVKFVASEKHLYSKKYEYAGIMDASAVIKRRTSVVDFKTGKAIYPEMRLQVSAYQAADEEETGKMYSGDKWIVRFGKDDGCFEAKQFDCQKEDFKAFVAAMTLKKRLKELDTYNKEK